MNARSTALLALSLSFVLAACKSTGETTGDLGVTAVQFQDVVVPTGMKLVNRYNESYSREEQGWRSGHFVYSGQPRIEEACGHVLARMPQHSWSLVSDQTPDDSSRVLKFTRGRYSAVYTLARQDGVTSMVVDYTTNTN